MRSTCIPLRVTQVLPRKVSRILVPLSEDGRLVLLPRTRDSMSETVLPPPLDRSAEKINSHDLIQALFKAGDFDLELRTALFRELAFGREFCKAASVISNLSIICGASRLE